MNPRLPRLITKGARAYWQASALDPDGGRHTVALGSIDDPQTLARYYALEARRAAPHDHLSFVFRRFEAGFLGEQPGDQGFRRVVELSPKTRHEYRRQLKILHTAFGAMPSAALSGAHVQAYLEAHPAPVSANREVALLSRIMTWARKLGFCAANPCLDCVRNEEHPRDRYISDEEYRARKGVAQPWMAALMDLAYLTALRLSDLLAIRLGAPALGAKRLCYLDERALHVSPAKTRLRHPQRIEFVLEGALREVTERLAAIRTERTVGSLYLIANRRGQCYTLSGFESLWQRLKHKDGNRDFQFRDIRAKSATDAADQGLNAQLLLAHSSARTTEIYLRSRRARQVQGPRGLA